MTIIGFVGYRVVIEIDRDDFPRLMKAYANMDADNPKEN